LTAKVDLKTSRFLLLRRTVPEIISPIGYLKRRRNSQKEGEGVKRKKRGGRLTEDYIKLPLYVLKLIGT